MDIKVSDYVDKNLITPLEIQGNVSGIGDVYIVIFLNNWRLLKIMICLTK